MYCPNCGKEIPDGAKFCPNCGTPAAYKSTQYTENSDAGQAQRNENRNAGQSQRNESSNIGQSQHTENSNAGHMVSGARRNRQTKGAAKPGKNKKGSKFPIILSIIAAVCVFGAAALVVLSISSNHTENISQSEVSASGAESFSSEKTEAEVAVSTGSDAHNSDASDSGTISQADESEGENVTQDAGELAAETDLKAVYQAYLNFVQTDYSYLDDYYEYQLIYVDNDEIPELWLNYNIVASGGKICTFDGENVNYIYTDATGRFQYLERGGLFYTSGGRMGGYYDNVYSLQNGEFTEVAEGSYQTESTDYANGTYTYEWNGQSVSEDEYKRNLEEAFDFANATDIYDTERYYYEPFCAYLRGLIADDSAADDSADNAKMKAAYEALSQYSLYEPDAYSYMGNENGGVWEILFSSDGSNTGTSAEIIDHGDVIEITNAQCKVPYALSREKFNALQVGDVISLPDDDQVTVENISGGTVYCSFDHNTYLEYGYAEVEISDDPNWCDKNGDPFVLVYPDESGGILYETVYEGSIFVSEDAVVYGSMKEGAVENFRNYIFNPKDWDARSDSGFEWGNVIEYDGSTTVESWFYPHIDHDTGVITGLIEEFLS